MPAPPAPARRADPLQRAALALAIAPGAWLVGRAALGRLGADPVDAVLNSLGLFAVWLLAASLACTPLQLLGWPAALRARKTLGLGAFCWAAAHALFFVVVDQGLDAAAIAGEVVKHRFILLGAAAFLLLVPLAATSTPAAQARLGFRRWKALHRLAWAAGLLGGLHYLARFKLVEPQPVAALALVGAGLLLRAGQCLRARRGTPRAPGAAAASPARPAPPS